MKENNEKTKYITVRGGKNISKRIYITSGCSQNMVDFLDIRYFYYDGLKNEWLPTKEGVHLLGGNLDEFLTIIKGIMQK